MRTAAQLTGDITMYAKYVPELHQIDDGFFTAIIRCDHGYADSCPICNDMQIAVDMHELMHRAIKPAISQTAAFWDEHNHYTTNK